MASGPLDRVEECRTVDLLITHNIGSSARPMNYEIYSLSNIPIFAVFSLDFLDSSIVAFPVFVIAIVAEKRDICQLYMVRITRSPAENVKFRP